MAMMCPQVDPSTILHDSERIVYEKLAEALPDDYVVIHSYPWLRPNRDQVLREGEADFVILHPQRGMLVLEVKGGNIFYENHAWYRLFDGRHRSAITNPFDQARRNMHALNETITGRSDGDLERWDYVHGYAVVFPHHKYQGNLPADVDSAILLDHCHLDHTREAIEHAYEAWTQRPRPLSRQAWNALLAAILPQFKLLRSYVADLEASELRIHNLTEEQVRLFHGLNGARRAFLRGVAGSGKTLMALDRALTLARQGRRTLLLCYNTHLADWLEPQARMSLAAGEQLHVASFHRLARGLIKQAKLEFHVPDDAKGQEAFWRDEVTDLLEHAITLLMDECEVMYDAIVLDEGQDFHAKWWECVNYSLLKEADRGFLFAFADPCQSLWDWSMPEPPVHFDVSLELQTNCRNTRRIARTSARLLPTDAGILDCAPEGQPLQVGSFRNLESAGRALMQTLEKLLREHGLRPGQITLIGPRSLQNACNPLAGLSAIEGIPLTDLPSTWREGNALLVTTARAFKGLESEVVVIYDLDQLSETFSRRDLYVACTRARSLLIVHTRNPAIAQEIKAIIDQGEEIHD